MQAGPLQALLAQFAEHDLAGWACGRRRRLAGGVGRQQVPFGERRTAFADQSSDGRIGGSRGYEAGHLASALGHREALSILDALDVPREVLAQIPNSDGSHSASL